MLGIGKKRMCCLGPKYAYKISLVRIHFQRPYHLYVERE